MRKHLIILFTIFTIVVNEQPNKTIYIQPLGQGTIEIDVLTKNYYIQRGNGLVKKISLNRSNLIINQIT